VPSDRDRVVADPALLTAARARYTGRAPLVDVLWWLEHPGEPTPEGRPDPAVGLESRRRALYRPGAGGDDRLLDDEAAAARDAEDARAAVAAALAGRRPAARLLRPSRRPVRLLVAAGVAGLLLGGAAGALLVRPPGRPAALAVFDRAQREEDRPPASAPLPDGIDPASLRLLGSSSESGTAVYAARARDGRVCLVAVVLALEFRSTCTSVDAFRVDGLRLAYDARIDPADLSGAVRVQEIAATWSPSGPLRF